MTMEEAVKESIRKYYNDKHDDTTLESSKTTPNKYDKKYFANFEAEQLGTKEVKSAKK